MDYRAYIEQYLQETIEISKTINRDPIVKAIEILKPLQNGSGRLFILGVGGSAASASHAVNDFRKLAGIETYAPTDNVSEITARTNDEGWSTTFYKWLETSKISGNDVLLVLSVGGGSENTSLNIKEAVDLALSRKTKIVALVSRDGGYSGKSADAFVHVPVVADERITPHAEGWHGVLWHLIVNAIATK